MTKLQMHLDDLRKELETFHPHCVLLLGNQPLRAFHPWHWQTVAAYQGEREDSRQLPLFAAHEIARRAKKSAKGGEFLCRISEWRGSIFGGALDMVTGGRWKCVAAYHPAAVLRQPAWTAIFRFDLKRAVEESLHPDLNLPSYANILPMSADDLIVNLNDLRAARKPLAFDLEGYAHTGITVCSFASDPHQSVIVPLQHLDFTPWWTPVETDAILVAFRALLEDPAVPKIMHNALYEMFVLRWYYGIALRGIGGDTMLKWHELFAELDKALEVPTSILTRQPYWKFGRDAISDAEMIAYNGIDTCVTLQINEAMDPHLSPGQRAHYEFNLSLLPAMHEQMFRGIRFDAAARDRLVRQLLQERFGLQGRLDKLARIQRASLAEATEVIAFARQQSRVRDWSDLPLYAKPTWQAPYDQGTLVSSKEGEEEP